MNAAEIVLLRDNASGIQVVSVRIAPAIPAEWEEMSDSVKSPLLAFSHFPMCGWHIVNAVNPLGTDYSAAAGGQIPPVVFWYHTELLLKRHQLCRTSRS